jgi:hypothetical protein
VLALVDSLTADLGHSSCAACGVVGQTSAGNLSASLAFAMNLRPQRYAAPHRGSSMQGLTNHCGVLEKAAIGFLTLPSEISRSHERIL